MLPPRAERDPRGHRGSGTSAAPGGPAGLAWGGKHGDDGGEYSTAGGTNKGRVARGVSVFSCPTSWRSPLAFLALYQRCCILGHFDL